MMPSVIVLVYPSVHHTSVTLVLQSQTSHPRDVSRAALPALATARTRRTPRALHTARCAVAWQETWADFCFLILALGRLLFLVLGQGLLDKYIQVPQSGGVNLVDVDLDLVRVLSVLWV